MHRTHYIHCTYTICINIKECDQWSKKEEEKLKFPNKTNVDEDDEEEEEECVKKNRVKCVVGFSGLYVFQSNKHHRSEREVMNSYKAYLIEFHFVLIKQREYRM